MCQWAVDSLADLLRSEFSPLWSDDGHEKHINADMRPSVMPVCEVRANKSDFSLMLLPSRRIRFPIVWTAKDILSMTIDTIPLIRCIFFLMLAFVRHCVRKVQVVVEQAIGQSASRSVSDAVNQISASTWASKCMSSLSSMTCQHNFCLQMPD